MHTVYRNFKATMEGSRQKLKDHITMDLKEIGYERTDWIHLAQNNNV